ncbi:D-cysteine desulfhydrase family protein [Miniphocaeibacter halophilus]|uniref:D-cysteine desulfhydrase family protein n=1 Tax=Miniphocaeibacter halophilus TaxID=2931922 RepID=A0AC61MPT5_9FIRM|nr:D-cysteine desulfhydrase family protein [Miniphocaeibacter halophilus]QQK07213.1 D-cysteine desulfhydrase family protein [Miniphocaeibacter halophilus]
MDKINLANLPTKIIKLEKLSKKYNKNIYLKRDDFTGTETSGNKVRKLEYSIKEALNNKCNCVITVGALQSNHCRATAAVCAKLGLECHLILKGNIEEFEGNLFLDYILGAKVHLVNEDSSLDEEMDKIAEELTKKGRTVYKIPVGASNKIGTYGYINTYNEILEQEKNLNIKFDLISIPVGSGGTYAGLWYGNYNTNNNKRILGFSVNSSKEEFKEKIVDILNTIDNKINSFDTIDINDLYVGEGYAIATREELEFYYKIASTEGIVFDPCYTGKAFRGLIKEIEKGNIKEDNILFIHTGGLMGWTKEQRNIIYEIAKERKNNEI